MVADKKTELPGLAFDMERLGPDLSRDVADGTQGMSPEEREIYLKDIERIADGRKQSFGVQSQKLALPRRPGYKRHWFNDVPGRIEEAAQNGWAHVKDKTKNEVKRTVGSNRQGGPLLAYAMEIPMPFWQADMRRRHALAADRMDQVQKNPISAPAGMAKSSDRGAFYSPKSEALSIRETGPIAARPEKAA